MQTGHLFGDTASSSAAQLDWSIATSTYRDDKTLPTVRYNYISHHPTTQLANLHSNKTMIKPTWGKISSTVWYDNCSCHAYFYFTHLIVNVLLLLIFLGRAVRIYMEGMEEDCRYCPLLKHLVNLFNQ